MPTEEQNSDEALLKEVLKVSGVWTDEILELLAPYYNANPYILEGVLGGITSVLKQKRLN